MVRNAQRVETTTIAPRGLRLSATGANVVHAKWRPTRAAMRSHPFALSKPLGCFARGAAMLGIAAIRRPPFAITDVAKPVFLMATRAVGVRGPSADSGNLVGNARSATRTMIVQTQRFRCVPMGNAVCANCSRMLGVARIRQFVTKPMRGRDVVRAVRILSVPTRTSRCVVEASVVRAT